jgi:SAM-dependent methyltransferase
VTDERLRQTFNEDAERYQRARPGYPAALLADLQSLAGIGWGSRVLEIGCGTGQATEPLARHGCEIVALDLGPAMATLARRRLARFAGVEVVTASFEDWSLPPDGFDAVLSATAWHWVRPEVRVVKSAQALRSGGALAVISTHHVAGGTADFFLDVQECYERWDPETPPGVRLPRADAVPTGAEEIEDSPSFATPAIRRYERELLYSATAYVDVLLTYSGHRAMDASNRQALLDCIAALIETRYGGWIRKRYLTQLLISRRIP